MSYYENIKSDISEILKESKCFILFGDFNVKAIVTEKHGISRNGKLLVHLIEEYNLHMVNDTEKCEGMWTRINTKNENEKSVLDYVICSESMFNSVVNMKIDEKGDYKPRGKKCTDHNTIIIDSILPVKIKPRVSKQKWNISTKTNWAVFQEELTQELLQSSSTEIKTIEGQYQQTLQNIKKKKE